MARFGTKNKTRSAGTLDKWDEKRLGYGPSVDLRGCEPKKKKRSDGILDQWDAKDA